MARGLVRAHAHRAPRLYNLRNDYLAIPQHLRRRVHDADYEVLASLDAQRPLVLDVGANVGQSIVSIKAVLPNARIVAFEPIPRAARRAQAIAARYADVEVRAMACGRLPDRQLTLYVPQARGVVFSQLASAVRPDPHEVYLHADHGGFTWVREQDVRIEELIVPSVALAQLGLQPDAIKLDVEGLELEVLQGAGAMVEGVRRPRILIVERGGGDEVCRHLGARGYELASSNAVNAVYRRSAA